MGGVLRGFPFLRSLEARKARRYKWGAYCRTNWGWTAVLLRQVVGVGVSGTLPPKLSRKIPSFSQNVFLEKFSAVDTQRSQTAVLVSTAEVWISAPDTQTPIFLGFLGIHSERLPRNFSSCGFWRVIQRFPGSFPDFPGSSPPSPEVPRTSPEVSPFLWEAWHPLMTHKKFLRLFDFIWKRLGCQLYKQETNNLTTIPTNIFTDRLKNIGQQLKKGVFGKGSFRNLCAEFCFVLFCVLRWFSPANLTEISFRNCPSNAGIFWKTPSRKAPKRSCWIGAFRGCR